MIGLQRAGPQKRADSYFPPEERVRLVRQDLKQDLSIAQETSISYQFELFSDIT